MMISKHAWNFPVEWAGLAVIAFVDALWAYFINFHLQIGFRDFLLLGIGLTLVTLARSLNAKRAALVIEYFCLSLVTTAAFGIFSYLAMASAYGPLVDGKLLAADHALGFDWLALYRWVMARPAIATTLQLLYVSMLAQGLIAGIALGVRGERQNMCMLFRVIFLSSFITCITAMLLPSYGPYEVFHIRGRGAFLIDMHHLISHQNLTFHLWDLTGVINFPSFHASVALGYAWGLRHAGILGKIMLAINAGMFVSIPTFGGHYLVDVLAGACVMLLSLMLARMTVAAETALPFPKGPALVESVT